MYSITSASEAHSSDIGAREIRYAISMGIRTVCFIAGIIVWPHSTVAGVVLFLGAIFLPYTSVIMANAGVRTKGQNTHAMPPEPAGELEEGRHDEDPS